MGKDSDDGSTLGFGNCQPFKDFAEKFGQMPTPDVFEDGQNEKEMEC